MKLRKENFIEEIDCFIYLGNGDDKIDEISNDIYNINKGKIKFKNLITSSAVEFKFKNKVIEFESCVFEKKVSFKGNNNKIKFKEINLPNSGYNFWVKEPESDVEYNIKRDVNNVNIENFNCKNLHIKFSSINKLIIINLIIWDKLTVEGSSVVNSKIEDIYIEDSKIDKLGFKSFQTEYPKYLNSIFSEFTISNIVYKNLQKIHLPSCGKYNISKLDFNQKEIEITFDKAPSASLKILSFNIEKVNSKLISIEQNKCDTYDFFSINSDSQINFTPSLISEELSIKIENFKLVGEVNNLKYLKNIKVNNLELNGFIPIGDFLFDNINDKTCKHGDLIIVESYLNNTTFKPSILHFFKRIIIVSSTIQNLRLIGFKYVEPFRIIDKYKGETCERVETLRFLKNTSDSHKDLNSYLNYKAAEFNETLKADKLLNYGDKITLYFNKYTNYHSTDWTKAGKLFLIVFLSYLSLIITYLYCSYPNFELLDASKVLPFLVSPVSFLMNYEDFEFHNVIYIFDFFYNIVIGLLLYQMIAAFRKFNR